MGLFDLFKKKEGPKALAKKAYENAVRWNEAATAYKRDGYFSIAGNLNEDIAAGDWTLYYTLDSAIAKVTTADVARVANLYLDLNQSVTGWFIPLTPPAAK